MFINVNRVGEMKLILGDPGKPDGWIPPDGNKNKLNAQLCNQFTNGESCKERTIYKIDGLEVNLFNITGRIRTKCCIFIPFKTDLNINIRNIGLFFNCTRFQLTPSSVTI